MKELPLTDLVKIIDARIIGSQDEIRNTRCEIRVSTDSRAIQPGDCFFAIAGPNFDGHNFLTEAFAKGAACAVVSKDPLPFVAQRRRVLADKFPDKVILEVPDTVKALGDLAAWYRRDCNFKVVAITGSVGKTTTREITHHVLSRGLRVFQSPKNFNNFIGLPLAILAASPDDQILVLELATNKPGEIEYLAKIAGPDIALITNVYPVHLAGLGTIEKIAEEKLAIAKGLSSKGVLIINADCQGLLDSARRLKLASRRFSCFDEDADYNVCNLIIGPLTSCFTIDNVTVELPLPGRGNVENTLASWSVCSTLDISARDFADAVKTISPVSMRTELLQIGSLTVISDCYNANPASMKNALDILIRLAGHQNRRAVFVCGDMAELGDDARVLHRRLGEQIAGAGVGLLITLGTLAALAGDAAKNATPDLQTHQFASIAELCDNLHKLIKDSDIILVKGSRINKLEMVVDKLKQLATMSHRPRQDTNDETRTTKYERRDAK